MRNIHYSRQLNDKRFVGSLEFVSRENSTFCNILAFTEGGVSLRGCYISPMLVCVISAIVTVKGSFAKLVN